jgi:hypothetical protein
MLSLAFPHVFKRLAHILCRRTEVAYDIGNRGVVWNSGFWHPASGQSSVIPRERSGPILAASTARTG